MKDYSGRVDGFSRRNREWEALGFLARKHPTLAPEPVWRSSESPVAIHSWIDGTRPEMGDTTLQGMSAILGDLHLSYLGLGDSNRPPLAVDGIGDGSGLREQISRRITLLENSSGAELRGVIRDITFRLKGLPEIKALRSAASSLSPTLSVSDFGPHNMLFEPKEKVFRIVDLEFFGLDDAHKLVGDTMLHPQIMWNTSLLGKFLKEALAIYDLDLGRLRDLLPFLSLKWATIVAGKIARARSIGMSLDQTEISFDQVRHFLELGQSKDLDTFMARIVKVPPNTDFSSLSSKENG